MRIERLDLRAFGPFTGAVLDLDAGGPALHVVYGPNEAGKSTALRALRGLLYGIDERTRDDHVHGKSDLRVGARIVTRDGAVIDVVRRKGRKSTLLAPDGSPVDDALIERALGGISESMFVSMFGLDHEALRRGAEALLEGGGDVGESLFDAALGGRGIHSVLRALKDEADEIFTPRAQKRGLNEAIRAFKEAKQRIKQEAVLPSVWEAQQKAIAAARAERDRIAALRKDLVAEKASLERAQSLLKLLPRRRAVSERLAALGPVPDLAEDAAAERVRAQADLGDATRQLEKAHAEVERLTARRRQLDVPESLASVPELAIDAIVKRLGNHLHAAEDLPKRRGELRAIEDEATHVLKRLGRAEDLAAAGALRPRTDVAQRLRSLAQQRSGLDAAVASANEQIDSAVARRTRLERRLRELPAPVETGALERALARAIQLGDVDGRIGEARRKLEALDARAARRIDALGLVRGSLDAIERLALPTAATIDRFAGERAALDRRAEELDRRSLELKEKSADVERRLETLSRAGDVPTEAQLDDARSERDALWRQMRDGGPDALRARSAEYEAAVQRADALSDRLRREADRVAERAALEATRAAVAREHDAVAADREALGRDEKDHETRWRDAWQAAGITPLSPAEMREWLSAVAEIRAIAAQRAELAADLDRSCAERDAARDAVAGAIGAASPRPPGTPAPLGDLVAHGSSILEEARRVREQRSSLEADLAASTDELEALDRKRGRATEDVTAWAGRWADATRAIGVAAGAGTEEAVAVLEALEALSRKLDEAAAVRHRIDAIEHDAVAFARDVDALVGAHAKGLSALPIEQRADALVRGYRTAVEHRNARDEIDEQLARLAEESRSCDERRAGAERRLSEMLRAAGAADVDALIAIEDRARQARELRREIATIDERLLDVAPGEDVAALEASIAGAEEVSVRARLSDVTDEIEDLDRQYKDALYQLVSAETGLEHGRADAADAAVEAEAHLARVRSLGHRWARLRLASVVLEREIAAWRDRHQGPILARAGELFPRLTLGAYAALRVGIGEQDAPVLRAARSDGREVGVEDLSDGTRDALYLSLRIATLEERARRDDPMPFVLDDVLIHLDDDRARAALSVLGDLARTTQVLFFTHHARLRELAREAVPAERLRLHDLAAVRAGAPARAEA